MSEKNETTKNVQEPKKEEEEEEPLQLRDKKWLKSKCESDQLSLIKLIRRFDDSHIAILRKRAQEKPKHVYAQYLLAIYYYMNKDRQTGESWLKRAAKGKYPVAMNYLGILALQNNDVKTAYIYYHRSANLGNADGACSLADLLMNLRRIDEAVGWFEIAAGLGHTTAQHKLGYIYDHGVTIDQKTFVQPNPKKALKYYGDAAAAGKKESIYNLGILTLHDADDLEKSGAAKDQIVEKVKKGLDLLEKAANEGQADACYRLGYILVYNQYGEYIDRNLDESTTEGLTYLNVAAQAKNPGANYILGLLYGMKDDADVPYEFIRVKKLVQYDLKKAVLHLKLAQKLGHAEAAIALKKYTGYDDLSKLESSKS